MKNVYFFLLILFLTKSAYAIEFQGKFIQGHFIIGKTEPETKVWIDKKKVKITPDGFFVFGLGRDRKYDVVITTGGTSVGKKDYVVKAISNLGEIHFQGVLVRPGKPITMASIGSSVVFAVPGKPIGAYTV